MMVTFGANYSSDGNLSVCATCRCRR